MRPRLEVPGEVEDVAHLRRPEAVDRLGVVADDGQAAPVGLQPQQDLRLQPVGVLILVDEHMVEAGAERGGRRRVGEHLRPVEQQVVEVEHLGRLLGLDVAGEERLQLGRPADAPGEAALEQRLERPHGRSPPASRSQGRCPCSGNRLSVCENPSWCRTRFIRSAESLRSCMVKAGSRPSAGGMLAQDADADAVEGAGPGEAGDHRGRRRAEDLAGDALDAPHHLLRRPPGEGHQQHAPRVGAREDQMRDPVRQRAGLAGAGAGDDQQRAGDLAVAMQHGAALGFVQPVEIAGGGAGRRGDHVHGESISCSAFVRKPVRAGECCKLQHNQWLDWLRRAVAFTANTNIGRSVVGSCRSQRCGSPDECPAVNPRWAVFPLPRGKLTPRRAIHSIARSNLPTRGASTRWIDSPDRRGALRCQCCDVVARDDVRQRPDARHQPG